MTRTVPALAAGIICGTAGLRYAAELRRSAAALARWEQLLRHLSLLISQCTMSLPEAFRQAGSENGAPDSLLKALAFDMQQHPTCPLPDLYEARSSTVSSAARPILSRMMARISRGSLDERVQAVRQAADEIALVGQNAAGRAVKDAKMWAQLGWTLGACVTLMLL